MLINHLKSEKCLVLLLAVCGWVLTLNVSTSWADNNYELDTYYPSPFGVVNEFRLYPRSTDLGTPCNIGTMYVNFSNDIKYCYYDVSTGQGRWGRIPGVWRQGFNTNDDPAVYTTETTQTLKVGVGTQDPIDTLNIVNTVFLSDVHISTVLHGATIESQNAALRLIGQSDAASEESSSIILGSETASGTNPAWLINHKGLKDHDHNLIFQYADLTSSSEVPSDFDSGEYFVIQKNGYIGFGNHASASLDAPDIEFPFHITASNAFNWADVSVPSYAQTSTMAIQGGDGSFNLISSDTSEVTSAILFPEVNSDGDYQDVWTIYRTSVDNGDGAIHFAYTDSSGDYKDSSSRRLSFDNNGNIRINKPSPAAFNEQIYIVGPALTIQHPEPKVFLNDTNIDDPSFLLATKASDKLIFSSIAASGIDDSDWDIDWENYEDVFNPILMLKENDSDVNDWYIGIGGEAPTEWDNCGIACIEDLGIKLYVQGSTDSTSRLELQSANPRLELYDSNNSTAFRFSAESDYFAIIRDTNGNGNFTATEPMWRINTLGNVIVSKNAALPSGCDATTTKLCVEGSIEANMVNQTSSRKFKNDIQPLDPSAAENLIASLEPVSFYYNNVAVKDQQIGFVAEDVPDLFAANNHQGVQGMDIISTLTGVVKKQQQQLTEQTLELNQLMGELNEFTE